jgi:hypothetical protein
VAAGSSFTLTGNALAFNVSNDFSHHWRVGKQYAVTHDLNSGEPHHIYGLRRLSYRN